MAVTKILLMRQVYVYMIAALMLNLLYIKAMFARHLSEYIY